MFPSWNNQASNILISPSIKLLEKSSNRSKPRKIVRLTKGIKVHGHAITLMKVSNTLNLQAKLTKEYRLRREETRKTHNHGLLVTGTILQGWRLRHQEDILTLR